MKLPKSLKVVLLWILISGLMLPSVKAESLLEQSGKKLLRGVVNVITGWVELPKNIYDTSIETNNPIKGITYGSLKGLGMTIVRTGVGAYDVVTFMIPVPKETLLEPEFVFYEKQASLK
jgi:putative exosortase-associated protein (TIGR04073 family)